MRKLLYCITAFLVATFFACSDSERNRQILLQAENCIEASPDSALAILEGIKYNDITSPEDRAVYSLLYTQARCKLMDIPESDSLIDSAISFFKANGDDRRLAVAYYYKGAVNYSRKKYETSVQFLKMAESLAEGADDELLKNKIYERLYIVNYVNENRRLALVYAKRFLESSLTFDDAELITRGCSGVASCFYLLGHADSTAVYLNKCVPYIDRLAPKLQASLWSYLAAVAYENRDVEQAERLLKKSFSIEEQPYANYIQGLMEFAAGNDDAARQCMEKALETDDEKLRGIIYERLAYYYNKNNIMGEAYDNILKKLDQLESAHDDGKQKNIIEQQLLLDLEHSAKKQHSRMLYLCLGGFAILSLLIVCIIFYRRKVGACRAEIESKKNDMLSYEADNTLYKVELDKYKKELETTKSGCIRMMFRHSRRLLTISAWLSTRILQSQYVSTPTGTISRNLRS